MHIKDAIGTEQNVTLQANWRYRRSRCKRIQLYRTDLHEVLGPVGIKLKKLGFGATCLFLWQIVIFRANLFRPLSKMSSRTPMSRLLKDTNCCIENQNILNLSGLLWKLKIDKFSNLGDCIDLIWVTAIGDMPTPAICFLLGGWGECSCSKHRCGGLLRGFSLQHIRGGNISTKLSLMIINKYFFAMIMDTNSSSVWIGLSSLTWV